jgi:hypothetical protein
MGDQGSNPGRLAQPSGAQAIALLVRLQPSLLLWHYDLISENQTISTIVTAPNGPSGPNSRNGLLYCSWGGKWAEQRRRELRYIRTLVTVAVLYCSGLVAAHTVRQIVCAELGVR